ncbi:AI-2E family transporter [Rhodopseudomonas palustris]|uniref:AI-2E family transporter n=1 Tax=Rhodopseudomonas palustris TaxID=1076 RepID=A0A418VKI9_RHOPL|nr:AI-2E family transporter [Rhodopseudomonas palustris]RJF76677.1 AI-2E family transporter [Rhodopseudomonas palustris]
MKLGKAQSLEDVAGLVGACAVTILAVIIIAALYVGREVFVPVALAILLSFVLARPVNLLQAIRVPRAVAAIVSVLLAFVVIFALGSLIATQLSRLAGDLPQYQSTIQDKITSLRGVTGGSSTLERAEGMLQDLSKELNKPKATPSLSNSSPTTTSGRPVAPVPVEVLQPDPGTLANLRSLIAPLISPLAMTGIIVIFVIFILLQKEDLRNRLIRLAGTHDLQRTTAALDDAAGRLSRLFLNQLLLNSAFGVLIGTGLWIIGVPSPALWGILAAVLRFVPYIGSIIAAAFPLTLAVAVDPGWSMLIWTAALFFIIEPAIAHVVEPLMYGRTTGLSPVAVVVSATFWTALWGPIGLVLATPLTVCLVVLGRHVERLAFLDVMFGDRPALSPPEIFYQRMLAGDPTEAAEKAEQFLKERSLSSYYDDVAMKGLQLAQSDLERGALDAVRLERIKDTVLEFTEDLTDEVEQEADGEDTTDDAEAAAAVDETPPAHAHDGLPTLKPAELAPNWQGTAPVLCIGGRSELDEAAALMLAHLSRVHGLGARAEPASALATKHIFALDTSDVALVCLTYLEIPNSTHIRYAVRRLRRKAPQAKIMVALLSATGATAPDGQGSVQADTIVASLRDAVAYCLDEATPAPPPQTAEQPLSSVAV